MSSIYIQEPPTAGKVLLHTTVGDIDIELWSKETPKACRNFVQLCLESYYDGTPFHRLVQGFIVQGGDPTGSGMGGDSVYGKPFKDEFHTRLRFVRRGLVAMANAGPNDNASQFFFTLGACTELQNKHTIFGKVTGHTLYNMLKLEDALVDQNEKPLYPHKIINTKVLSNPFPDIIPRSVKKDEKNKETQDKKNDIKGTKNYKLLSFGEEAEEEEAEVDAVAKGFRGKSKSSHDLTNDPKLSTVPAIDEISENISEEEEISEAQKAEKRENDKDVLENIKKKLKKEDSVSSKKTIPKTTSKVDQYYQDKADKAETKREEVRAEIKKLRREIAGKGKEVINKDDHRTDAEKAKDEEEENNEILAKFREEKKKFKEIKSKLPKKGQGREQQTLELLAKFQTKLQAVKESLETKEKDEIGVEEEAGEIETSKKDTKDEDNDDPNWLGHVLKFEEQGPIFAKDANIKDTESYDLSDPRNPLNMRRREASKQTMKGRTK